jgi:hypothetical protein
MVAPGKVVTLDSPHPPEEVLRRLRAAPTHVKLLGRGQATLHLPTRNNQRRFFFWIEPNQRGGTRLTGQMQTPLRVATLRLLCALVLAALGIYFMMLARFWFGMFFEAFALGFVMLSQWQRLIGRDLVLHVRWLQQLLEIPDEG